MSAISFQIPEKMSTQQVSDFHSIFTFRPFEKGYGVTIGNSLRRVLLSSLEGHAITSIKVPGVQHEFSTIEGMTEDVVELVLNLKQVRLKKIAAHTDDKIVVFIKKQKTFKAGDIAKFTSAFEVMNPDFVICHLDPSAQIELEVTVEQGHGYVPAEENTPPNAAIGLIPIDAIFTPVKNVKYKVENFRVEQKTDYEKLTIDLQTDGTVHPDQALKQAANILVKHFSLFSDDSLVPEADDSDQEGGVDEEMFRMRQLLKTPLAELELSARASNCLKAAELKTLGDIVSLSLESIEKYKNFGTKSINELSSLVASKNLSFGMDISKYKLNNN